MVWSVSWMDQVIGRKAVQLVSVATVPIIRAQPVTDVESVSVSPSSISKRDAFALLLIDLSKGGCPPLLVPFLLLEEVEQADDDAEESERKGRAHAGFLFGIR